MSFARITSRVLSTAALPFLFLRGLVDKSWRESLEERCGLGGWAEENWEDKDTVWFHGASVGEILGLAPLLVEVKRLYPELHLLVTTTSLTGREEALKRRLGDSALLFPLDHPAYARRVLESVRPRLIVICETELWPNFLFTAKDLEIPVMLVNARISDFSYKRYLRSKSLFAPLLREMRHILTQTASDAERFISLGAETEKVTVCGSTKYSRAHHAVDSAERRQFAKTIGIELDHPCLVAGSVRTGEDLQIIEAYLEALKTVPDLQLLLAPRHPERFIKVGRLLRDRGIAFNRRSDGEPEVKQKVVLLDTLGELQQAYSVGSFAFVGGSLVKVGGHNPFEPAECRAAIIMGPHYSNVKDAVEELEASGGLLVANDNQILTTLIIRLAKNPDECLLRGTRAYDVWKRNSGAIFRVLPVLETFLQRPAIQQDEPVELQVAV